MGRHREPSSGLAQQWAEKDSSVSPGVAERALPYSLEAIDNGLHKSIQASIVGVAVDAVLRAIGEARRDESSIKDEQYLPAFSVLADLALTPAA